MDDRRERDRFQMTEDAIRQLTATMQYNQEEACLPIQIRDLSKRGLGFRCEFEPEPNREINIAMNHRGVPIRFRATLRWVKQVDGAWCGGCEFARELEDTFLTDLSDSQVLDPNAAREASWVRAIVRSDIAPDQKYPAEIVNYSRNGVCLATKKKFGPGESLLLEIDDNHRPRTMFVANVVWERPEAECILQGCMFPADEDTRAFYKALTRHSRNETASTGAPTRRGLFRRIFSRR